MKNATRPSSDLIFYEEAGVFRKRILEEAIVVVAPEDALAKRCQAGGHVKVKKVVVKVTL